MIDDEYIKHLSELGQVQATVPEALKYSAHFEFQDLCNRLNRVKRSNEQFHAGNALPVALASVRNHKLRIGQILFEEMTRSKSTSRQKPALVFGTGHVGPVRGLVLPRTSSKREGQMKSRLNASVRLQSLSPRNIKNSKLEKSVVLDRSFTMKKIGTSVKSLRRQLTPGGSRSILRSTIGRKK